MKTKKWMLAIMVCAALCVWFAGCDTATSEDEDENVISYSWTEGSATITYSYYKDGTFTCASRNGSTSIVTIKGTYTGNPAIDGEITEVTTHNWSETSNTLVTVQEYCEEKGFPYNSSDWVEVTMVSGGSFTIGSAPDSTTFTRD